eukprot:6184733-Pleurochrysis_carterae.AAC.1
MANKISNICVLSEIQTSISLSTVQGHRRFAERNLHTYPPHGHVTHLRTLLATVGDGRANSHSRGPDLSPTHHPRSSDSHTDVTGPGRRCGRDREGSRSALERGLHRHHPHAVLPGARGLKRVARAMPDIPRSPGRGRRGGRRCASGSTPSKGA